MTNDQMEKGYELQRLIETTSEGLKEMKKLRRKNANNARSKEAFWDDKSYLLSISEYDDGSGCNAKLTRYFGNAELLDAIIDKLEEQLKEFTRMFEEL